VAPPRRLPLSAPRSYDTRVTFLDPITKYDSVQVRGRRPEGAEGRPRSRRLPRPTPPPPPPSTPQPLPHPYPHPYPHPHPNPNPPPTPQGYLFNIKFLKLAFTPEFTLHDMRPGPGPADVTTRWTMAMRFAPARALGLAKIWDPEITFTGGYRRGLAWRAAAARALAAAASAAPCRQRLPCASQPALRPRRAPLTPQRPHAHPLPPTPRAGTSTYGFNPANGKINKHIDTWDSITNQKFFSFEAFGDFLRQVGPGSW
jgi:hypothetical protein